MLGVGTQPALYIVGPAPSVQVALDERARHLRCVGT